jgi:hypothetical protein
MPLNRRPPDRRARLLDFAAELLEDLETVDLDTIDGEFYWRWCRVDLLEQLEQWRIAFPDTLRSDTSATSDLAHEDNLLTGWLEDEEIFDYLRQGLRFVRKFLDLEDAAADLYPGVVWRRLIAGERVAMRAAEGEVRYHDFDDARSPLLSLKVFSGAWIGFQVDEELERMAMQATRWYPVDIRDMDAAVTVHVTFRFVDEAQAPSETNGREPARFPYVLVETSLPLPPKATIAREYDALVRDAWQWHRQLPGSDSRQDKEVALRTWTIGLLMRHDLTFNQALARVQERLDLEGISQTRFGQDRLRLVERVPEARGFIFVTPQRLEQDTRASEGHAVANSSEATLPLQALTPEIEPYP